MKKTFYLTALIALLFTGVYANTDLITATEFMGLMKSNKSLVIIDASKASAYKISHIKGAVNIPHTSLYQEGEIEALIKSPAELAKIFGKKGVSDESSIVVYDNGSQKYSSRVYWILKYLGVKDVFLLHKDMAQWKKARIQLTRTATLLKEVTFAPHPNENIYADAGDIKASQGKSSVVLVDARTTEEYQGISEDPVSPGHIPGAISLNYQDVLNGNKAMKSKAELETIAHKAGIGPDKEIILYCRTSVRAAVLFVAFKDVLEYPNVKVYDGALVQWLALGNPAEK